MEEVRATRDADCGNRESPSTPVTVATPIVPLPEVTVRHPSTTNHDYDDTNRPHLRNRMFLCLLAVAVNWGTTLRIANHFASRVIHVPSLDFVTKTCKTAYNVTRNERLRYSKCVESQLTVCNRNLDRTTKTEDEQVRRVSKENEYVVQRMEEVATSCSKSYTTLRLALEDWTANGGEIPLHSSDDDDDSSTSDSTASCSAEDQEMFNQTLLGTQNTIALQTQALQTASAYSEESTETVERLALAVTDLDREIVALDTYVVERVKYDVDYIERKTEHMQDKLLDVIVALDPEKIPPLDVNDLFDGIIASATDLRACMALDPNVRKQDGTKCDPSMSSMVNDFVEDAKWKVEVLNRTLYEYRETLYEYRDRMEEYKQNAMNAYDVAKRFYDGAMSFIRIAKPVVFWLPTGDWFDIKDRDFFPIEVSFPDVDITITDIGQFVSIDAMWQQISPIFDAFLAKLSPLASSVHVRFDDLIEVIMMNYSVALFDLISELVPDDYNPPTYIGTIKPDINPKEELLLYKNTSKLFLSNTRSALGMFTGIGNQYDEDQLDVKLPTFNITEIKNKVTNIDLTFEDLQQPDMDFDLWFIQFNKLSDGFVLVDYVFRAYVSIRLLIKYWFATSLAMPSIDLRANKEIKNPFRMHPVKAVVAFLTSPMGGFILFLLSSTWIVGMIAGLYHPMLKSYTSGCVQADGNGTFITKNLFSVAYNHAYQDGSGILIEGMDAFDLKRGDTCSSRYTSSATLQNSMSSNFSAYSTFHRELSSDMGLAQRCINSNKLDDAFRKACCGAATYPPCSALGVEPTNDDAMCPIDERRSILNIPIPHELPGISLDDSSCSLVSAIESGWIIEDAIFDCEQLGTCSVTCSGPRKPLLTEASERCGCTIEWYLHSKWMGSTFAFLLYVFMNIARVSFFSGITRLLWIHIYPDRFTVSATCDSEGSLVTSSKISGTSHEDLINALQTRSRVDEDAVGDDDELSKELHAKIDSCLKSFYASGVLLLLASLVANGVWIYALSVTSQTLSPHVWQR